MTICSSITLTPNASRYYFFRIDRGIAGRIKPYLQPSVQLSENFDILANV